MEVIRITNPMWLGTIGPRINEFVQKAPVKGLTYETLYAYLAESIQFGEGKTEFWVVMDEEKRPIAFAHWFLVLRPYVSKTGMDAIYKWTDTKESVDLLIGKWIEFGVKTRCKFFELTLMNRKVAKRFEEIFKGKGYLTEMETMYHLIHIKET